MSVSINKDKLPEDLQSVFWHNKITEEDYKDILDEYKQTQIKETKIPVDTQYWTKDYQLSAELSGTRKELHTKLDILLDKLLKDAKKDCGCGAILNEPTFRFEVTQHGYDGFNEESNVYFQRLESDEEFSDRQQQLKGLKVLADFYPKFKDLILEQEKSVENKKRKEFEQELQKLKEKFGVK